MFTKVKTWFKKAWKWTLGVLGVGVIAVALTIPNGAVPLSKYELAQNCIATPKKVNECLGELNHKEKALIKSQEIANSFKTFFMSLWKIAKP